jgi:hypothetical protein
MNESFINSKIYKILHFLLNAGLWVGIGLSVIIISYSVIYPLLSGNNTSGIVFDGFILTNNTILKVSEIYFIFIAMSVIISVCGIICIWMLKNIINSLRSGTPFTDVNVRRIRIIGWTVFAYTYLRQILNYLYIQSYSDALINNGMESVFKANFTVIPNGVILALCIIIIAEIFRYGCVLQQEHDTTV